MPAPAPQDAVMLASEAFVKMKQQSHSKQLGTQAAGADVRSGLSGQGYPPLPAGVSPMVGVGGGGPIGFLRGAGVGAGDGSDRGKGGKQDGLPKEITALMVDIERALAGNHHEGTNRLMRVYMRSHAGLCVWVRVARVGVRGRGRHMFHMP